MNRTTLGATLLLHGALLLAVCKGLGPTAAPATRGSATEARVTVSLHSSAPEAARVPGVFRTAPPLLQAPPPVLIAAPELPPDRASPSPARAEPPALDRAAVLSPAPGATDGNPPSFPARSGRDTQVQARDAALVPAALPPDHQDCKARQVERHYPALLRERGIEGRVLVRVKVDEDGRASEVLVQGASGWRLMDEAARQVAAACAYQPARRGEQGLMAWIEYPIRFTLRQP